MDTKTKTQSKVVQAVDNISRLKSLIEEGGRIELEIAFLAKEIYYSEEYRNKGYANFGEFAKAELAVPYRKIMWLLQIGTTCDKVGITKEQLLDSGVEWTKLKELTHLMENMSTEDIKALFKKAKDMSYQEVEDMVRQQRMKVVGGEVVKVESVKFKFVGDQINTVELAISVAKEIIGTDNSSQALEYICGEWLQNHQENTPKPMDRLEEVQEVFGPETQETPPPPKPRKERADVLRKKERGR